MRYGENPHQGAAFYRDSGDTARLAGLIASYRQLQGKELSYNNIADADAAWECVRSFDAATEAAIIELLQNLRSQRKTVFVVHHDLQTVRSYFDYVILLNMRLVACGPTETTFTPANLHETYGGRLTILDEAAEAVRNRVPIR